MLFLQLRRVLFPLWSSPHKAEVRRGNLPADDGSRGLRFVPLPGHHHSCLAPPGSLSVHGSLSELPKQCHFGLGDPHIQGTHFEPLRVSELIVGWLVSSYFSSVQILPLQLALDPSILGDPGILLWSPVLGSESSVMNHSITAALLLCLTLPTRISKFILKAGPVNYAPC